MTGVNSVRTVAAGSRRSPSNSNSFQVTGGRPIAVGAPAGGVVRLPHALGLVVVIGVSGGSGRGGGATCAGATGTGLGAAGCAQLGAPASATATKTTSRVTCCSPPVTSHSSSRSWDEHAVHELDVDVLDVLLGGIVVVLVEVAAPHADHERGLELVRGLDRRAADRLLGVAQDAGILEHLLLEVEADRAKADLDSQDVEAGQLGERASEQARDPVAGEVLDDLVGEALARVGRGVGPRRVAADVLLAERA